MFVHPELLLFILFTCLLKNWITLQQVAYKDYLVCLEFKGVFTPVSFGSIE